MSALADRQPPSHLLNICPVGLSGKKKTNKANPIIQSLSPSLQITHKLKGSFTLHYQHDSDKNKTTITDTNEAAYSD